MSSLCSGSGNDWSRNRSRQDQRLELTAKS
jgi:hypothetical protein